MIRIQPWSDDAALAILRDLDVNDALEAALWRGGDAEPLSLWADWRMAGPGSLIAAATRQLGAWAPFALMALTPTGAAGVASAALMARDHARWRPELIELARHWRETLPGYCAERGVTRCECRSWVGHPTAARLLRHIGFRFEARLAGFGGGAIVFDQYAWTAPNPSEET